MVCSDSEHLILENKALLNLNLQLSKQLADVKNGLGNNYDKMASASPKNYLILAYGSN